MPQLDSGPDARGSCHLYHTWGEQNNAVTKKYLRCKSSMRETSWQQDYFSHPKYGSGTLCVHTNQRPTAKWSKPTILPYWPFNECEQRSLDPKGKSPDMHPLASLGMSPPLQA